MKYYIIAGEASGDLHASNLIKELAKLDVSAEFRGFGGDLMQKEGFNLVKHYREMAFMGLMPVLLNIRKIKNNFKICEQDFLAFKPDVLILVDYPGFNLRMAKFAKKNQIATFYYISPKIWAWKKNRVFKIKKFVDEMFTIFPFETEFYKNFDYKVNYVGNPLLDAIHERETDNNFETFISFNKLKSKPIIALLPGSRKSEISVLLPIMLAAGVQHIDYQCVIAGAPNINFEYYNNFTQKYDVPVLWGKTYDILSFSKAAIVSSGTATLETGLLKVPQVVVYQMTPNWLFQFFKKYFLKTKWVSLVNIILGKEAVVELIQSDFSLSNVSNELDKLINDLEYQSKIRQDYDQLIQKLGNAGASVRAANLMFEKLKLIVN